MQKYDFFKYSVQAAIVGVGCIAYDSLYEGKSPTESFVLNDALVLVISSVASNVVYDVVSGLLPFIQDSSIIAFIGKPLLSGVIYMLLFDMMIKDKFPYFRDGMTNFYIGSIGSLLELYLQNPVLSLFGMKSFY